MKKKTKEKSLALRLYRRSLRQHDFGRSYSGGERKRTAAAC